MYNNLVLHILTPYSLNRLKNDRDMHDHLITLDHVLKMTPESIDWILLQLQQPLLRVALRPPISNL